VSLFLLFVLLIFFLIFSFHQLPDFVFALERLGRFVAERRMPSDSVVIAFDVFKGLASGFFSALKNPFFYKFCLESGKEAF
jgi:hypothetical protein